VRVLLDANVLVSGIAFRGNEHKLLRATFRSPHAFLVSDDIMRETASVLARRFPRLRTAADEILSLIRVEVILRSAYEKEIRRVPALRDPGDAHVLAAAAIGRADLIVTGDRGLLDLRQAGGSRIVSPSQALRILEE